MAGALETYYIIGALKTSCSPQIDKYGGVSTKIIRPGLCTLSYHPSSSSSECSSIGEIVLDPGIIRVTHRKRVPCMILTSIHIYPHGRSHEKFSGWKVVAMARWGKEGMSTVSLELLSYSLL